MSPVSLVGIVSLPKEEAGSGTPISIPTLPWYFYYIDLPRVINEGNRESFIGMLTDEEASEAMMSIERFKKRFEDDLTRRNTILFGE